jgi:hypothetical protein
VTGRLPRPIEQVEHFLGIGQAHDQRGVAQIPLEDRPIPSLHSP